MADISYATSVTPSDYLETLILTTLPNFGEHGNGILNLNAVLGFMKINNAYEKVEGGLETWFGVSKQESTNAKWQGRDDDMNANDQDPLARLRYAWKILTNSLVINDIDRAMNRSKAMVKSLLVSKREQAVDTIENMLSSGLWDTAPSSTEIESIPKLISTTPTTGTIGGLTRSTYKVLQNKVFTDAITDIGSEGGLSKLFELQARTAVGKFMANLIILGVENWSGLAGFLEGQRRFKADERMAKIGWRAIELATGTIVYEAASADLMGSNNTINSSFMYGINTKFMKVKQLIDPTVGTNGWETEFKRIGQSLKKAVFYKFFGNLCDRLPRAHFVASNVGTS